MSLDDVLLERCEELVCECSARGLTVSTAESCTAGLVASSIADVPGASAVLRGGAVTYCNEVKHKVLGVGLDTLQVYSAVSYETAREMAQGSRRVFDSDVAVSLTGYAGPDGGTPEDPAGTVYLGLCTCRSVVSHRFHFAGDRNEVRMRAAIRAVELLLDSVRNTL